MLSYVLLILGFGLVIKAADWLVAGSSSVAVRFKVPAIVVGLTIVAFGTSFPELVVNAYASYQGNAGITLGNILGSNLANILLILGVASIIYPLRVQSNTIWKEIPFSLLAAVVLWLMVQDVSLNFATRNVISRTDGLILLSFFVIFLYYMWSIAKNGVSEEEEITEMALSKSGVYILLGLVGLFLGGKWVVDSAVEIAASFGVTERVIGLTVVALGTSLPELVTSATAAMKHKSDIAIGNVVGSNIFNILWIMSVSSLIAPVPVSSNVSMDIGVVMIATLIMFSVLFVGRKSHLTKIEGVMFLILYFGYIGFSVMMG